MKTKEKISEAKAAGGRVYVRLDSDGGSRWYPAIVAAMPNEDLVTLARFQSQATNAMGPAEVRAKQVREKYGL
jgi:hypothetical protein